MSNAAVGTGEGSYSGPSAEWSQLSPTGSHLSAACDLSCCSEQDTRAGEYLATGCTGEMWSGLSMYRVASSGSGWEACGGSGLGSYG